MYLFVFQFLVVAHEILGSMGENQQVLTSHLQNSPFSSVDVRGSVGEASFPDHSDNYLLKKTTKISENNTVSFVNFKTLTKITKHSENNNIFVC